MVSLTQLAIPEGTALLEMTQLYGFSTGRFKYVINTY